MNHEDIFTKMKEQLQEKFPEIETHLTFGHASLKIDGKVFTNLVEGGAVFKLAGPDKEEALLIKGSHIFDPMKTGRGMGNWVVIPDKFSDQWYDWAMKSITHVREPK
jgi:hypothetical protein